MDRESKEFGTTERPYEPPVVLASVSQAEVSEMVPDDLSPHVHTSVNS